MLTEARRALMEEYTKPRGKRVMVRASDAIQKVKAHRGPLVAFASGFGAMGGKGAMEIDRKRLLKKLDKLAAKSEVYVDMRQEGSILYVGFALTFLNDSNFDKHF